jgi:hypothetical protein
MESPIRYMDNDRVADFQVRSRLRPEGATPYPANAHLHGIAIAALQTAEKIRVDPA